MNQQTLPLTTVFRKYPMVAFRQTRWFYPIYDGTWLLFLGAVILALHAWRRNGGPTGIVAEFSDFRPSYLLAIVPVTYFLITCNLFAHNVAHRNFPKAVNRIIGEVVALMVLTRYASWEIIHLRHHQYSDQPGKDPHDCRPGFFTRFLPYFLMNVERQLKQQFFDFHGGRTPENVRFERWRAVLSFGTNVALIYAILLVLGAPVFCLIFLPAQVVTIIHLAHFNWATHNGFSPTRDYHPLNLDHGLYWLGNRIFFGIYYHANHHRVVKAFNPMYVQSASSRAPVMATELPAQRVSVDASEDRAQPV
jgi:fatty acid desaturase